MKKLFTLLICLPLFTFGQQTINASINHGGLERDYTLYIPASYSAGTVAHYCLIFMGTLPMLGNKRFTATLILLLMMKDLLLYTLKEHLTIQEPATGM